jgi:hypothetical protein
MSADLTKTAVALKHFNKYFLFFLVVFSACDSEDSATLPSKGYDYFPLRRGFYQIYDIDETKYSEVSQPVSSTYQLMTHVIDSFPNTGGGITYVIHRSTRKNENAAWIFLDTWSARTDLQEAILYERNTPFVKLSFPTNIGRIWNGNKFNNEEEDVYELKKKETSYAVKGLIFEDVLIVEQELEEDPIVFTDIRTEVYAKNAGLIYKETTQLQYCTDEFCLNDQIIESGVKLKQEIREYGFK